MRKLEAIRANIDTVDEEILSLLARRALFVGEIAIYKATTGEDAYQPERFVELMDHLHKLAGPLCVSHELVDTVWQGIHEDSVARQEASLRYYLQ